MIRAVRTILWDALKAADRHGLPRLGAALAFYTLFSLAPLLLVVVTGTSLVFEQDVVRERIRDYAVQVAGPDAAQAITAAMRNASVSLPSGPEAVFGILVFFLGSTAAFNALLGTLNLIWEVEEKQSSIVWPLVRRRLIAFGLVLVVGAFGLLSLVLHTVLSGIRSHFPEVVVDIPLVSPLTNLVVWIVLLTMLIATIYRVVPEAPLRWRDMVWGAVCTAVLFSLGSLLIGQYIGSVGIGSVFGAASSVVLMLLWVYYSAQVFLLGAEITHAHRKYRDGTLGSP